MLQHVQSSNRRFPQRARLLEGIIHLTVYSRVGYFFWLNDRIATIKLAKASAIIKDSKTVNQQHPLSARGCADHP